jgi:hypothetical protein
MAKPDIDNFMQTPDGSWIGVSDDRKLYWNNKPILTEQKITVEWWVSVAIVAASVSTVMLAVLALLQFFGFCAK